MLVSVLSDTHGILDDRLMELLEPSDLIIHAGDIGSPFLLDALEAIAPVKAVLGNCDWDEYGRSVGPVCSFELEDLRIFVAHTPDAAGAPCDKRYPAAGERGHLIHRVYASAHWNINREMGGILLPHLVIHGHTHVPRLEVLNGVTVLNPGSATKPKGGITKPSFAQFEVTNGALQVPQILTF